MLFIVYFAVQHNVPLNIYKVVINNAVHVKCAQNETNYVWFKLKCF